MTRNVGPGLGLLLLASTVGCGGSDGAAAPENVSARLSDAIATVVKVSWTTSEPSTGYVEYGPTGALGTRTPPETTPATDHEQDLLGLEADTDYSFRVVTRGDDGGSSSVLGIRTGDLPLGMPPLTLTGEGHEGFILAPVLGATTAVLVIDAAGKIVWYH